MKNIIVLVLCTLLLSCIKKIKEEPLQKYFNSENQNTFEEFQEVLSNIYIKEQDVNLLDIPLGLYTFYEVNNQIQTPTNSFLLADFISVIQAKEDKGEMVHYNIRETQIHYDGESKKETIVTDSDFFVPKPISPKSIRAFAEEPSVTLHNLVVEQYKKQVPKLVKQRENCGACELNVYKISVDVYNRVSDEVEHIVWEISTDILGFINSDFQQFDGTVSRCTKRWIQLDEGQNVYFSQCWVLRDYGVLE